MTAQKSQMKKPIWLKYSENEVRDIILKIAEKNPEITTEKIGIILRDNYGIPATKIYGFKIGDVLKKAGKYESADRRNLAHKIENLLAHIKKHGKDERTRRSLIISKSKLKKVEDYLKSKSKK